MLLEMNEHSVIFVFLGFTRIRRYVTRQVNVSSMMLLYVPKRTLPLRSLPNSFTLVALTSSPRLQAVMKIIKKEVKKDEAGSVKMVPQEAEDMWREYSRVSLSKLLSFPNRRLQLAGRR